MASLYELKAFLEAFKDEPWAQQFQRCLDEWGCDQHAVRHPTNTPLQPAPEVGHDAS